MNRVRGLFGALKTAVIAVRVSGGHLCEAEAPTEPAGETAVRRATIRFSFKGITDSFTLRVQNNKPFSCCSRLRKLNIRSIPSHIPKYR